MFANLPSENAVPYVLLGYSTSFFMRHGGGMVMALHFQSSSCGFNAQLLHYYVHSQSSQPHSVTEMHII